MSEPERDPAQAEDGGAYGDCRGSPPSPREDGATWVESGTFKVDRQRALEELSQFQLQDPEAWLLPWVRAAVAAGATRIDLRSLEDGLRMRFDGRPFDKQALEDPYGPLFQTDGEPDQARRQLTIGLLACLRAKPAAVEIGSGEGEGRHLLRVRTLETDSVGPPEAGDTDKATVIRVVKPKGRKEAEAALARVRRECGLSPIPVFVDEVQVAPAPVEEPALRVQEGWIRGRLQIPESLGAASSVELHVLGVRVGLRLFELPAVQVRGQINDDLLRLDASQSGVVEDERFEALARRLGELSLDLVVHTGGELARRMPKVSQLLLVDEGSRRRWTERMRSSSGSYGGGISEAFFSGMSSLLSPGAGERSRDLEWTAHALKWLRALCGWLVSDPARDSGNPLRQALWDAPLYLACDGRPMSLARIDELCARDGVGRFSREPYPGKLVGASREDVVWVLAPDDLTLLSARYTMEDVT